MAGSAAIMTKRLWAIGDLHLGFSTGKWMDKFGDNWKQHHLKVEASWSQRVASEDIVLLPGDFSWAMRIDDVAEDFRWLQTLPGKKVLIKGNHDYWWPRSKKKMTAVLPPDTYAMKKTALVLDGVPIVGVRGGDFYPLRGEDPERVAKELEKEQREFRLSVEHLQTLGDFERPIVAMFHYPPFPPQSDRSVFTDLIEAAGCKTVVYGHLHSQEDWDDFFQGDARGVTYHLTSCDALNFEPLLIDEWE